MGAEGFHRSALLVGEGVGGDDVERVTRDGADERQRAAGAPARVLDHGLAGPEPAGALGTLDHGQCHAVLIGAGGVGGLQLHPDLGHVGLDEVRELHYGRVPDGGEHAGAGRAG